MNRILCLIAAVIAAFLPLPAAAYYAGPPAGWTLISSVTTSGTPASVAFTSIPQTFSELLVAIPTTHCTGAGIDNLGIAVGDATPTYSGNFSPTNNIVCNTDFHTFYGQFTRYTADVGIGYVGGQKPSVPTAPYYGATQFAAGNNGTIVWAVTGGIKSLKVSYNSGTTIANGVVVSLYGR